MTTRPFSSSMLPFLTQCRRTKPSVSRPRGVKSFHILSYQNINCAFLYQGVAFLLSLGLSLKRSCLIKAIGGVPSPRREYNSRVMPVAFLIAGSMLVLVFFFFCAGATLEMDRTSRISALVIVKVW